MPTQSGLRRRTGPLAGPGAGLVRGQNSDLYSPRGTPPGGQLSADLGHGGAGLPVAASAVEHSMMLVTGNARYFEPADIQVLNPFGGRGTAPA